MGATSAKLSRVHLCIWRMRNCWNCTQVDSFDVLRSFLNTMLISPLNIMLSTFSCDDSDENDDSGSAGGKKSKQRSGGMRSFCRFYRGPVRRMFRGCVRRLGNSIVKRMMRKCYMDIRHMWYDRRHVLTSRCNAIENLYDECGRRTEIRVNPWRSRCGCSEYHLTRCSHILVIYLFCAIWTHSEYIITISRSPWYEHQLWIVIQSNYNRAIVCSLCDSS